MERNELIGRALDRFAPGRLVDLGTGHGGYTRLAVRKGWKVTAVDARDERFPEDLAQHPSVEWRQSDLRAVDLEGHDLVLCLGVFYHLTLEDQLDLLARCSVPMIIDTHVGDGVHHHALSERVEIGDYSGRLYEEPGKLTSSWGNPRSFWPELDSLYRMLHANGFPVVMTMHPWVSDDRAVFVALP